MRTNSFLRAAALSLALAAPAFASAHANIYDDYNYGRDVWPGIQAEMNATKQVVGAQQTTQSDAGRRAAQSKGIYDRSDRDRDPRTGDLLPGLTLGGF